ncbi:MAG: hypothetical protein KGR98_01695 [Verrucomicrobia bacterium]|nr:hypothetical protein [Verrucomicrobiota bacterium]MDE3099721.1 hypothetical protein [Verrucomicrobiota bacterium]
MNALTKKILLTLAAVALLAGAGRFQGLLNRDRAALKLTISTPLRDAPPVLAFSTVALGGFRGLISNFLWMRADRLQQADKFFEAVQLEDWITDLEPHFAEVWAFESWNMAWNISVKFKDAKDRWRWVQHGLEMLRDKALKYDPDSVIVYQQLAWIFQFKMGANVDDANRYYKQQWAEAMTPFFGPYGTNIAHLVHPVTAADQAEAATLRETYKMDPALVQQVNRQYGPLDWRLPEASAIYWAVKGLQVLKNHPDKKDPAYIVMLRRAVFQSMSQAFKHGRIIANPYVQGIELAPDLDLIPKVNDSYLEQIKEDPGDTTIPDAQRYFLADAVYFLYENDRVTEAAHWYKYLVKKFPDLPLIQDKLDSLPKNLTLNEYVIERVQEDIGETSQDRVAAAMEALLTHAYLDLAIGQNSRATGYELLAQQVYDHYQATWGEKYRRAILPPMADIKRYVLDQLLDPAKNTIPFAARAAIRTQLQMPPETNSAAPFAISTITNAPSSGSGTNSAR